MGKAKTLSTSLAVMTACAFGSTMKPTVFWEAGPSLAEGVAGGAIARVADSIVYAGGTTWRKDQKIFLSNVLRYSPSSRQWREGPALPEPLAYGASISGDSFMEVFGGASEDAVSKNCWRLERGATEWKSCGTLPRGSVFAGAAAIGMDTYLLGGCSNLTDLSTCTSSVFRRKAGGQWTHVSDIPGKPLALAATAELKGHIYLFGGCTQKASGGVDNQSFAYRFDPARGTWKKLNSLPLPVRSASAMALDDAHILIVGGYGEDPASAETAPGFRQDAWIYNADTDIYKPVSPLPFGIAGMGLTKDNNTIIGVGGEDRIRGRSTHVIFGHFVK